MSQPVADKNAKLALMRRVDEACQRFEDCWREGGRPLLVAFLSAFTEEERAEVLPELLLLEWTYLVQRGESFYFEQCGASFPALRQVVEQTWQRWKGLDPQSETTEPSPTAGGSGRSSDETVTIGLPAYEQVTPLGKGGMGEVSKAFDPRLQRWVALKQVRVDRLSPGVAARFRLEALALASLQHPHIVKVHEHRIASGDAAHRQGRDGQPVLVMEFVGGGTLEQRLNRPLPASEAARLVAVLAWAVHAAHAKGIVHRDLKPANVLMDEPVAGSPDNVLGGYPKIADFGLAALAGESTGHTLSGAVLGTPAYMAPEQAVGQTREIGPKTDVWALGVILYRALTGQLPFAGSSVLDTLERVKTMQFRPVLDVCPAVPDALAAACMSCLRKLPGDRPTAAELATLLQEVSTAGQPGDGATQAYRPRVDAEPGQRWSRRAVAAGMVAATVLTVGVLAGVVAWWMSGVKTPADVVEKQPEERGPGSAVQGESLPVARWTVRHYEPDGVKKDQEIGTMGVDSWLTRYKDKVVIEVDLSGPACCYLLAFNFNGEEQLLLPCDTGRADAPGDPRRRPERTARLRYPPLPAPGMKAQGFELSDDAKGGLQAFLLVASRQPLPAYAEWRGRGEAPWRRMAGGDRVWEGTPEKQVPRSPARPKKRGRVVPLNGQPPLVDLCRWARDKGAEVVKAFAFPVNPQEGK